MSENILVTGGAGYIGSHACKKLRSRGFIPICFDNLSTGWQDSVKFGPFVYGDLCKKDEVDKVFSEFSPIAVMHFAALSQVGESVKYPELYWQNNVLGSLNLIQSAISNNCKNFILSSTCAVFGDQDKVLLNEESHQFPNNPYGKSKRAVENMLADCGAAHELFYNIFRYFNVAGADPDAQIGEYHKPESHLIPLILDVAMGLRDNISVFGDDYDTPDGTCVRDYVHVCDVIDAHILGLESLLHDDGNNVFNLGSGTGYSVQQVISEVEMVTKKLIKKQVLNRRVGDAASLIANPKKAASKLGWVSSNSTLDKIITDAWRWHKIADYTN